MLLQKTLLNIEGLGRQLDPDLDLWKTAKPYLEQWMSEQVGWRAVVRRVREEAPDWAQTLPQLPRLAHRALRAADSSGLQHRLDTLDARQRAQSRLLRLAVGAMLFIAALELYRLLS